MGRVTAADQWRVGPRNEAFGRAWVGLGAPGSRPGGRPRRRQEGLRPPREGESVLLVGWARRAVPTDGWGGAYRSRIPRFSRDSSRDASRDSAGLLARHYVLESRGRPGDSTTRGFAGRPAQPQEAPGEYFYENGLRVKRYRGMASLEAMQAGGAKRYLTDRADPVQVPQGVSGTVVDKGSLVDYLPYLMKGLSQAFQDMGYRDVPSLHAALYDGRLRFERRTTAALAEGTVHRLYSYVEPRFGIK